MEAPAQIEFNPVEAIQAIVKARMQGVTAITFSRRTGKMLEAFITKEVSSHGMRYRTFDDGLPWHALALIEGVPHCKAMIADVRIYWPAVKTTRGWE